MCEIHTVNVLVLTCLRACVRICVILSDSERHCDIALINFVTVLMYLVKNIIYQFLLICKCANPYLRPPTPPSYVTM